MKISDKVRLKRDVWCCMGNIGRRPVAKIRELYLDIPGGVILDTRIGGFYSWNVEDLEPTHHKGRR